MVAEVQKARQEVRQCEEAMEHNLGECVAYFQEVQEAKAELECIDVEGRQRDATDNQRQRATRARAREAVEE
eukprot:10498820-Heterocapsa_arctica.AAC.1